MQLVAYTDCDEPFTVTYQIADVSKPLNSVGRICDGQKWVVLGAKGGYIQDRWSGARHYFQREGSGVYALHTWIQKSREPERTVQTESDEGFARQG